jgi:large subunit ribosomal protein L17
LRHKVKGKKIGSDASHRKAILNGLAIEVFKHERIKTTKTKAKEARDLVEKIVGLAKRGDVHSRRQALAILGDRELTHKVFEEIGPRFKDRDGGYTRILKLGPRAGDSAPMVYIELV